MADSKTLTPEEEVRFKEALETATRLKRAMYRTLEDEMLEMWARDDWAGPVIITVTRWQRLKWKWCELKRRLRVAWLALRGKVYEGD